MGERRFSRPTGPQWALDQIPFQDLDRDLVHADSHLFWLLTAASFIEITSDLYSANLVAFYRGDDEVAGWLSRQWEPEELRHGAALKRYVETAWPDFDWNTAYQGFLAEFSRVCKVELLAATRTLELAARCVVETGTATLYRTLAGMTDEPVLQRIAILIAADEVRHYKYFYRFFRRYRASEPASRLAIAKTLWARTAEIDDEDAFLALKHVFLSTRPGACFDPPTYAAIRAGVGRRAKGHYPYQMAVRMMLKPLALSPPIVRVMVPPIAAAARMFFPG